MKVVGHALAEKEDSKLGRVAKRRFTAIFRDIAKDVVLPRNKFKKLSGYELYELRVKTENIAHRALGAYMNNGFTLLVFFKKKSQKVRVKTIKLALNRYKDYI